MGCHTKAIVYYLESRSLRRETIHATSYLYAFIRHLKPFQRSNVFYFSMETRKRTHFFLVTELHEKHRKLTTVLTSTFCWTTTGYWFCLTRYLIGQEQHSSALKWESEVKATAKLSWKDFQQVLGSWPQTDSAAHVSVETMTYAILLPKVTSLVNSWSFRGSGNRPGLF